MRSLAFVSGTLVIAALAASTAVHALETPGRKRADHVDAAAELALANAEASLASGDASGALLALAAVPEGVPPRQAFRRGRIEGRALLRLGRAADAVVPLRAARAAAALLGTTPSRPALALGLEPGLEIDLALAEAAAGECTSALPALRRAGAEAVFVTLVAIEAQVGCQLALGRRGDALASLGAGIAALDEDGPAHAWLRSTRARLLVEDGLSALARETGDVDAIAAGASADELAALALQWSAAPSLARILADAGSARFPDDVRFPALAARLERNTSPHGAARAAVRGAALDPSTSPDAAELARADGSLSEALRHNALGGDARARLRQRLAIAVDAASWDRALALAPPLREAGLLDDDAIAYALAWASHATGDDDGAEALLDGIEQAEWFERATSLRAEIVACRERPALERSDRCAP